MIGLNDYVGDHFSKKDVGCEVVLSGSDIPGEGEHKIFEYIRTNKFTLTNKELYIYGLDADLIMLCLNHTNVGKNIYLYREMPDYATKEKLPFIMNIREYSKSVMEYMSTQHNFKPTRQRIVDYIFISFLLGNDFLPHFPALNIRTTGIDYIMSAYDKVMRENTTLTYDETQINWKFLRILIQELANNEEEYIKGEYDMVCKNEKRNNGGTGRRQRVQTELDKYNDLPSQSRDVEHFIDPYTKGWEFRYYKELFGINITHEKKREICLNYLSGLQWVLEYYSKGCIDVNWKYNYHYPPLLKDLIKFVPAFKTSFFEEPNREIVLHPLTQLSYVLPASAMPLLPQKLIKYLRKNYPSLHETNCKFVWAFCKYIWESHVEMYSIDILKLDKYIKENY